MPSHLFPKICESDTDIIGGASKIIRSYFSLLPPENYPYYWMLVIQMGLAESVHSEEGVSLQSVILESH